MREARAGQGHAPHGTDGRGGFPWVTWGPRQALWGVAAGLGLGVLIAPLLVLPFDPDLDALGATLAAQLLLDLTVIATALYVVRRKTKSDLATALARLGWRRFRLSGLGAALLTLFAYFISVAIYASVFVTPHQKNIGGQLGLDKGVLASIAAVTLIAGVAPVAEESFFRGFFFGGLRAKLPLWLAALISGLVFGGVHAPEGPTAVVPLALLGVALAVLYERTGSLWPCIFAHAVNNSLALAVSG